ncbi:MAG: hypothetical protein ACRCV9_18475 [Burkholderiaceae bacterium]
MRQLTPQAIAALSAGAAKSVMFVEMQTSPPIYLNSSPIDIDWNAITWKGAGALGTIEPVTDRAGDYQALRFTLSGVSQDALALALSEQVRGKACYVYFVVLDADTEAVLDVDLVWSGALDRMPGQQSPTRQGRPGSIVIGVEAIHAGEQMQRARPLRFTAEDIQKTSPGDTSGRFILSQAQEQIAWPAASFFKK